MAKAVPDGVENIVRKEDAGYHDFVLFPCFQKPSVSRLCGIELFSNTNKYGDILRSSARS